MNTYHSMKTSKPLFATLSLTLVVLFHAQAQDPFTNGLVAYYPFKGNAIDQTGSGYNGTVNGAQLTFDRLGNPASAYSFNGSSDYIVVGKLLPDSQQFTVSAWIRPEDDRAYANIFYDAAFFTSGRDTELATMSGGNLRALFAKISDPGPDPLDVAGVLTIGVWTHVLATTGPNGSKIYVNGLAVATSANAGNNVGFHSTPYIGAANHGPGVQSFFRGGIDDVRIYNRVLSSNEVATLYALESGPRIDLIKAVKPALSSLLVGTNYQLQLSGDLLTWTNHGASFAAATNTSMVYPQYWDVDNWDRLFFRLQVAP